jgi:cytochrome c peroxidase
MFKKAFGTDKIDSVLTAKALAQFVRTLVSFDSKFDKWIKGQASLDSVEQAGLKLIQDLNGGDCFHCHNAEDKLFTSAKMSNNGLDFEAQWTDLGFYNVTGLETDKAKFKTPTLRNVALTGPYMHDGRFNTLPEVIIQHYNTGGKLSPTIDVFMEYVNTPNGLDLSPNEVNAILKFLNTLTDTLFITNPKFSSPF